MSPGPPLRFRARRYTVPRRHSASEVGAGSTSPQSVLEEDDVVMHQRGHSPDLAAMPSRSTFRVEILRELDGAALAAMLPQLPSYDDRRAVAQQAASDQWIRNARQRRSLRR